MELTNVPNKRLDSGAGRDTAAETCLVIHHRLTRCHHSVMEGDHKSFPGEALPHHCLRGSTHSNTQYIYCQLPCIKCNIVI